MSSEPKATTGDVHGSASTAQAEAAESRQVAAFTRCLADDRDAVVRLAAQ